MTKRLDDAIEAAGQLPPEKQDEIALTIFEHLLARPEPYVFSDSEREAIREGFEQAGRGEEVEALFARYLR